MMTARLLPPLVTPLSLVDVVGAPETDEPPVVIVFTPSVLPQPLLGVTPLAPAEVFPPGLVLLAPAEVLPPAVVLLPPVATPPAAIVDDAPPVAAPPVAGPLEDLPPVAAPPVAAPPVAGLLEDLPPVAAPPVAAPPVAGLLTDVPPVELPLVLPPLGAPPEGEELAPPTFDGPESGFPSLFPEQPAIIVTNAAATK